MVVVHHLADVVIDVETCAAVHDGVYLVEQFVEGQSLDLSYLIEANLSVDGQDDAHLVLALVDERADAEVLEAVYLVLLAVAGNELAELGAVAVGFAYAHTLDVLQLFDAGGVGCGHVLERGVLEDDVGRQVLAACHVAAQVLEHGKEGLVEHGCSLACHVAVLVEFAVLGDEERLGLLHVVASLGRDAEQTIVLDALLYVAGYHGLTNDGIPEGRFVFVAAGKQVELFVAVCYHVVCLVAHEDVDDVLRLEAFLDGIDDAQDEEQLVAGLHFLARMQTVVALAAVVGGVLFAEVMQEELASADGRLGIGGCLLQQLSPDVLFCDGLALHEFLELAQVARREECDAEAFASVASGTACLLVVAFEALGYVVVYDVAYVGLVDAHAEGDGGHDDVDALHEEVVLCGGAFGRFHAGVVGSGVDVVGAQHLCQLFHAPAAQTIDDAALAFVLEHEAGDVLVHVLRLRAYLVVEVGTVERAAELCGVGDAEVLLDVGPHLVGGGGCEGDDGRLPYLVGQGTYVAVLGTEVVTPFRDAMCFVDSIEGYLRLGQEADVLFLGQRLGCDVEQLRPPFDDVLLHRVNLRLGERGVEVVGYAVVVEELADGIHLVFHEGNKWRDDDGCAFADEGWQLVTKRLAAAGWHKHKGVLPVEQVADDGLLVALEGIEAKVMLELF